MSPLMEDLFNGGKRNKQSLWLCIISDSGVLTNMIL